MQLGKTAFFHPVDLEKIIFFAKLQPLKNIGSVRKLVKVMRQYGVSPPSYKRWLRHPDELAIPKNVLTFTNK